MTKAQTKAQNKYIKNKYDRHNLFMPKGTKADYQESADRAGQSLNAYIILAVEERRLREGNVQAITEHIEKQREPP